RTSCRLPPSAGSSTRLDERKTAGPPARSSSPCGTSSDGSRVVSADMSMTRVAGGMRRARTRLLLVLGIVLVCSPTASALDPAHDVTQYAHTAWLFREGL